MGVTGRMQTFKVLEEHINAEDKTLWFHCASLGEYEQGLPVFKALRTLYPKHKFVLTFFSPSGYEIRKKNSVADVVVYLPLDTKLHVNLFLDIVNPELTIFVKYEIWPNFLKALKERRLRALLISALFKPSQAFFKFYGKSLKEALFTFDHIFTQDETSKVLLESINYTNVTVSGDTRFDRVYDQLKQDNSVESIVAFKQNRLCIVAGSTWPEDEALLVNYINSQSTEEIVFIVAPHNIKSAQIEDLQKRLNVSSLLYSQKNRKKLSTYKVLIIDSIGLLSKLYSYADIAYVGGAMGKKGLHNTLEPAIFGIPIIIGKNYSGFPEAVAMIHQKGMITVSNKSEMTDTLNLLIQNPEARRKTGAKNLEYIKKNKGAVIQIIDYIRKYLEF